MSDNATLLQDHVSNGSDREGGYSAYGIRDGLLCLTQD